MIEHDGRVGAILKAIDDLGVANNTIVIYGTDNGPHMNSWQDGAMTPFRSEKITNWEGAYRVPAMNLGLISPYKAADPWDAPSAPIRHPSGASISPACTEDQRR
jgi:Sulfatase